jgi:hypothetical protein
VLRRKQRSQGGREASGRGPFRGDGGSRGRGSGSDGARCRVPRGGGGEGAESRGYGGWPDSCSGEGAGRGEADNVPAGAVEQEFEGTDVLREEIKKLTKPEQALEFDEKERRVKLRTLGNIKLFKQKMLPEKIVHACIQDLLGQDPKAIQAEEKVEAGKVSPKASEVVIEEEKVVGNETLIVVLFTIPHFE